jgi:hypothetical protein
VTVLHELRLRPSHWFRVAELARVTDPYAGLVRAEVRALEVSYLAAVDRRRGVHFVRLAASEAAT